MTDTATTMHRLAAFVPERSVPIDELAEPLGLNRHQLRLFRRVHGLDRIRLDPDMSLVDLLVEPAAEVVREVADPDSIAYLIFAHTVEFVAPPSFDMLDAVRRRLGLRRAEAFAVTQQHCASGLAAVDIAGTLLRNGDEHAAALVITGEKPYSRLNQLIFNTTIMGQASTAALVTTGGPGLRLESYVARTDGTYADGLRLDPDFAHEFGQGYTGMLADVMQQSVQRAGLTWDDIDLVVPHNVNRSSWLPVIKALPVAPERFYLNNIARFSHCFCSDPFLNLVSLRREGLLVEGHHYLLTAVGLGATYAAMVIRYGEPLR
jgi:3-oxoacyl-[acyl-carrier-protein] synthase-3